jgi:hypothetical protein
MGRAMATRAALGFRAHTGWSAAIAIAGEVTAPLLLWRGRIEMVPGPVEEAEVYHHAQEMGLAEARAWIDNALVHAIQDARAGISAAVKSLAGDGWRVAVAGIVDGSGRMPPDLEAILRSHPRVHGAEGEHYRQALARACDAAGLAVRRVVERELVSAVAAAVRIEPAAVARHVAAAGRGGGVWGKDQKEAMLAAWAALASRAR